MLSGENSIKTINTSMCEQEASLGLSRTVILTQKLQACSYGWTNGILNLKKKVSCVGNLVVFLYQRALAAHGEAFDWIVSPWPQRHEHRCIHGAALHGSHDKR